MIGEIVLIKGTQTKQGIKTYIDPNLSRMNEAYKAQFREFLQGALKCLK